MKVFVLKYEYRTSASGDGNDVLGVYATFEDAQSALKETKKDIVTQLRGRRYDDEDLDVPYENGKKHWMIEHGEFDEFQELTIVEKDMQCNYRDLRTEATSMERAEFLAKVDSIPVDSWDALGCFGAKVYPMPKDKYGTTNCVILADVCDGYIYVEIERIVKTSRSIFLEGTADGEEYQIPLNFVMDGYLQEVTCMI